MIACFLFIITGYNVILQEEKGEKTEGLTTSPKHMMVCQSTNPTKEKKEEGSKIQLTPKRKY